MIPFQLLNPLYIVLVVLIYFAVVSLIYLLRPLLKKDFKKTAIRAGFIIPFLAVLLLISFTILFFFIIGEDYPPTRNFHELNALVKQRCVYEHEYCPQTAEEVRSIAPEYSKKELQDYLITYEYYPGTHDYTLILRNKNFYADNSRAAVFDSRLPKHREYGYNGLDLYDVEISPNGDGTYSLKNPPPFVGPWKKIK